MKFSETEVGQVFSEKISEVILEYLREQEEDGAHLGKAKGFTHAYFFEGCVDVMDMARKISDKLLKVVDP